MVGNAVIKQRPVKTGESVISTSPTPMSRSLDLNQNKNILAVVLLRTTFCEICPISVAFDSFSRISPLFTNFRGKRHEFFAYAALQLKFVTLTTKIGEKRRNSWKNCQMQPKSGKFRRKMFLNNPTSSKISFYLILVNID